MIHPVNQLHSISAIPKIWSAIPALVLNSICFVTTTTDIKKRGQHQRERWLSEIVHTKMHLQFQLVALLFPGFVTIFFHLQIRVSSGQTLTSIFSWATQSLLQPPAAIVSSCHYPSVITITPNALVSSIKHVYNSKNAV